MKQFLVAGLGLAVFAQPGFAQNVIPMDANSDCVVSADEFTSWKVSPDSLIINPPNSFENDFNSVCAFYKWGAQMFLWLTSPTGEGRFVFDDTGFFDVVHDGDGTEKIASVKAIKNGPDEPNIFALRNTKADDRGGSGQAGGNGVLVTLKGDADETGLTYYGMHVNDAYVAFLNATLSNPKDFNFVDDVNAQDKLFPISSEDMEHVIGFGLDNALIEGSGAEIALLAGTLELKTSWVPVENVAHLGKEFVTIKAQVPKFDRVSDTLWTASDDDGTEMRELAMVGMHIAGPVLGHPELVWASFEHLHNSPMAPYAYTSTSQTDPVVVPYENGDGKSWIYTMNTAALPTIIKENAAVGTDGNIEGVTEPDGTTLDIAPVDVALFNPWGNAPVLESNDGAGMASDVVSSNTDLIALNASLLALLEGDPAARDNYYQIGSIWAEDKKLPVYPMTDGQAGGLRLANSTMETFHQFGAQDTGGEGGFVPQNCFACHGVSGTAGPPEYNAGTSVSHIFQGMFSYPHKD